MRCWRSSWLLALLLTIYLSGCGGVGGVEPSISSAQSGTGSGGTGVQGVPRTTVAVGQAYSFQPDSSGLSGALTFSATNLPQWLTLNTATGQVTGTPTESDVGTYSGITLVASNGTSRETLGPFTITVSAQGSGTAALSWMPPTENSDGSPLTDLAGFVVLYGLSPTDLTQTITIDNPSVSSYVVENLTSGTWYFAVQAANTSGARSDLSSLASKTIG